jgi:hypothetical protein
MKPRQYVKKYHLDESEHYDRNEFMADFTNDFMSSVEISQSHTDFNLTHWENLVKQARSKFDGIVNKSKGTSETWEKTWKYFYATVVVKLRDELFGELLAKKRAAAKEKWERENAWRKRESEFANGFYSSFRQNIFEDFINNFFYFMGRISPTSVPTEAFSVIGLPDTASEDEIKEQFRKLALKRHSDKGGSDDAMHELIQARNKCVAYSRKGAQNVCV